MFRMFLNVFTIAFLLLGLSGATAAMAQELPHNYWHHADATDLADPKNPHAGKPLSEGWFGNGHAKYHKEYMQMHNQNDTHCCDEGDCRPTSAYQDAETGKWIAMVDGVPTIIEPDRHVKDAYGLNGFASVCASETGALYCFIPPYQPG